MPIPIDVRYSRTFSGTTRRIYQLLSDMGTSGDAIWPFAAQPFMRTSGPLTVGTTEEWHLGMHAILDEVVPEERIVWRIDTEGVAGTHGFFLSHDGKKTVLTHQMVAELSDPEGRLFWRRLQDAHERAIDGLFEKLARVLKR
jgi:carbon monoxide dehydrogenase subunit G